MGGGGGGDDSPNKKKARTDGPRTCDTPNCEQPLWHMGPCTGELRVAKSRELPKKNYRELADEERAVRLLALGQRASQVDDSTSLYEDRELFLQEIIL